MSRLNKPYHRSLSTISPYMAMTAIKKRGGGYLASYPVIIGVCGIAVLFALMSVRRSSQPVTSQGQEKPPQQTGSGQDAEFKAGLILSGRTEDGTKFSNQLYRSPDCLKIVKTIQLFQSSARVYEELQKELGKASSIIERGYELNDHGQRVGERVVAQFPAEGQNEARAEVIWSNHLELHSITASSLQYALEFEQWLRTTAKRNASPNPANQTITFRATQAFDGKTEDGYLFSERQFQSSDCEAVSTRTEYFGSPTRAREELQKNLKNAVEVVEQRPRLNAVGDQVGERAVVVVESNLTDGHMDQTLVMWTENSEFHSIRGPSLQHVLEFEKRYYP